jgi:hypothetical protein
VATWGMLFRKLAVILSLALLVSLQRQPVLSLGAGSANRSAAVPVYRPVNAACGTILFSDDFNDGNASGWTPYFDGTWYVENNEYVVSIGGGADLRGISLAGDTAWTDYVFEVDLKADVGASKIILFRYSGENNYYSVGVIGLELYDYYKVNLVRVEDGVGTTVLNNDYPHDNAIWHHVWTLVQGSHIVASVDGDPLIDYNDAGSSITHGEIGLQGFTGSIAEDNIVRFDNVIVRGLCSIYVPVIAR